MEDFSEEETKVLCALTYFTLPASIEHIHAIADPSKEWKDIDDWDFDDEKDSDGQSAHTDEMSIAAVETALRSLANRSLAVPTDELKTFTLVPMVADFLRKKKPDLVAETGGRLETRAYALIIENGYQNHDHFPELEAAWAGIAPALPLLLAGDNQRLQVVCNAVKWFLESQGRWDEGLALFEKAEARAVAAADHNKAGWRAYDAGFIHYLRHQADTVLICADRATAHWARAKAGARERAIAIALRSLGHKLKKDYLAAITACREALDLHRSLGAENSDVATGLNDLANAEQLSGDLGAAEEHYREALRVARAANYADGEAYITGNLAAVALAREDWLAAETMAREALSLSEAVYRQDLIAEDNRRLAQALVRQGKTAEALPYARCAVDIYDRLGSPDLEAARATLKECEE